MPLAPARAHETLAWLKETARSAPVVVGRLHRRLLMDHGGVHACLLQVCGVAEIISAGTHFPIAIRDQRDYVYLMSTARGAIPEEQTMMPRMEITWAVLEAAKDAGDAMVIAACRRIINADRIGWRKHGNPADYRLVLDFYAA
jgi:hypothetical protein